MLSTHKISEIRARYGIKDGEVMILFVGRLITVKGIVNLVKAMQPISDAHSEAKLGHNRKIQ